MKALSPFMSDLIRLRVGDRQDYLFLEEYNSIPDDP